MKICGNCKKKNSDDALFCEDCGESLAEAVLIESGVGETIENEVKQNCPNCGNPVNEGDIFCDNCGWDFSDDTKTSEDNIQNSDIHNEQTAPQKEQSNEPKNRKSKVKIMVGSLLALFLLGGGSIYLYGKDYYSKDKQIDRFIETLASDNVGEISKVLVSEDPNFEIKKESIEPFVEYIGEKKSYVGTLKGNLTKSVGNYDDKYSDIKMLQQDKFFGIYDRYVFVLKPIYTEVHTNLSEEKITIDGNEVFVSANKNEYASKEVGPFAPGKHQIITEFLFNGEESSNTDDRLMAFSEEQNFWEIDATFELTELDIYSNFLDANAYVNNKKIGTLVNGHLESGELLWNEGMTIQLKADLESGTMVSEEAEIELGDDYINLDFPLMGFYEAENIIKKVYSTVASNSSNYYTSTVNLDGFSGYFKDGTANGQYTSFVDYINNSRSREEYGYVDFNVSILSDMQITDVNTYNVPFEVTYNTYYMSKSNLKPRVQTFKFNATIEYDTEKYVAKIVSFDNEEKIYDNNANE